MKKQKWLIVIVFLVITGFVKKDSDIYFEIAKSIDIFGKVYREVAVNYVDDINPEEFMISGIKGMLSSLDPYTVYIDESMKKDIDVMTTGKYGGIGASVGLRNDKVTVIDLMEGYSAQRQGIRVGDVIKKVDDVKISKNNYEKLSSYLKGEPGKVVSITIGRVGVPEDIIFELLLEEVIVKNLTYYDFVPEGSNNVYLKLSGFSRSAGNEIKKALLELKKQKTIESIVLDLRGNPGGLLDQAIDVSEKFLKKNRLVVSVIGRDSTSIMRYKSKEEPLAGESKLAVLIDHGSASASEIVAGAIQDHDRGILLGTQSFGKGLVQTVLPLSFNTSLKITTAKYYTPSGRSIQEIDYSKDKNLFQDTSPIDEDGYYTDNMREVFANGGITPDTIISNSSESKQIKVLLARGMFFRFATSYFNTIKIDSLENLNSDSLFSAFLSYLEDHKFEYTSKSEKLLGDLKELADTENLDREIVDLLNSLDVEYQKQKKIELVKYQSEILSKIKEELAARIDGRKGRIKESLKTDKQFEVAINILQDSHKYNYLRGAAN